MNTDSPTRVPQWLYGALDSALLAIGATANEKTRKEEIERLLGAWNLSERPFHNSRYLSSVLEKLDSLEAASTDPEMLRVAFAYRGSQSLLGWEDAGASGATAPLPTASSTSNLSTEASLARLGVPAENAERVVDLVHQLSVHSPRADDIDAKIIIDADMAILAAPPQQYKKLVEGLRDEGSHLNSEEFLRARRRSIKRLLARRNVFFSPVGRKWDEAARENLEAELSAIETRLANEDDDSEPLEPEAEQSDKVVIRKSIRTPSPSTAPIEQLTPETVADEDEDDEDLIDNESDSERGSEAEDDLASTSTLELLPDIFDAIKRHRSN